MPHFAVVYVGGTCLPLEPATSNDEIQNRAEIAGANKAIVCGSQMDIELSVRHKTIVDDVDDDLSEEPNRDDGNLPVSVAPDYRSHIFFTSGTTGTPKGVEVLGRGIMRLASGIFHRADRVG